VTNLLQFNYCEGLVSNDAKWGYAVEKWSSTGYYEGQYRYNTLHGYGVFHWTNGNSYAGQWMYGKMNGYGVYRWPGDAIYQVHPVFIHSRIYLTKRIYTFILYIYYIYIIESNNDNIRVSGKIVLCTGMGKAKIPEEMRK